MTETADHIFFKDSEYDFDHILLESGFNISKDLENEVIFQKDLTLIHPFDEKVLKPFDGKFTITVVRPKRLWLKGQYNLCSPYIVTSGYCTIPNLMIRRISWDTFPGNDADLFKSVLRQCQSEAQAILAMFLKVDSNAIETSIKTVENQKLS